MRRRRGGGRNGALDLRRLVKIMAWWWGMRVDGGGSTLEEPLIVMCQLPRWMNLTNRWCFAVTTWLVHFVFWYKYCHWCFPLHYSGVQITLLLSVLTTIRLPYHIPRVQYNTIPCPGLGKTLSWSYLPTAVHSVLNPGSALEISLLWNQADQHRQRVVQRRKARKNARKDARKRKKPRQRYLKDFQRKKAHRGSQIWWTGLLVLIWKEKEIMSTSNSLR